MVSIGPDTNVSDLVEMLLTGRRPLVSSPIKQVRSKIRRDIRGINAQFQRNGMASIRMGAKINYAK